MIQGWSGLKILKGGHKTWVGYLPKSMANILLNDEELETFLYSEDWDKNDQYDCSYLTLG